MILATEVLVEGEVKDIRLKLMRTSWAGVMPTSVSPEYRILNSYHVAIDGYDWAAATWDSAEHEIYASFDSTAEGLTAVGTYFMQFRAPIGSEIYEGEVEVHVDEFGP